MKVRTASELRQLMEALEYNRITGKFTWRRDIGRRRKAGAVAGTKDRCGYIVIGFQREHYFGHRLAIAFTRGEWSSAECIDHINCDPADNSLSNLRECTLSQNQGNRRKAIVSDRAPLKGVSFDKRYGRYEARINTKPRAIYLGRYATAEEAHAAYLAGAKLYFGEFARVG